MRETKVYVDTEFTDFIDCELISIAAVTEHDVNKQFYGIVTDYDKQMVSNFVHSEVVPILHIHPANIEGPFAKVATEFSKWLRKVAPKGTIIICADYVSDWIHVRNLLAATRFNTDRIETLNVDPYTNSIGMHEYTGYFLAGNNRKRHNALDDAHALRRATMITARSEEVWVLPDDDNVRHNEVCASSFQSIRQGRPLPV